MIPQPTLRAVDSAEDVEVALAAVPVRLRETPTSPFRLIHAAGVIESDRRDMSDEAPESVWA